MKFVYSDGGRSKYFKADNVGDCVTRAICNATGKDYLEVYNRLKEMAKKESVRHHKGQKRSSVRDGVFKETWKRYLKEIGWVHHSVTSIGNTEKRMRLVEEDLPEGNLIVQISRHLTNVKDKVIYDTYDCSKKQYYDFDGNLLTNTERCVYGYWTAPTKEDLAEQNKQKQLKEETKLSKEVYRNQIKEATKKYDEEIKKLKYQIMLLEGKKKRALAKINTVL